jgi:nucleotide-binding universal stress UspA family protein
LAPERTGRRSDIGSDARDNPGTDDADWPGKGNNGPSSEDYRLLISCDASNSVPDSRFWTVDALGAQMFEVYPPKSVVVGIDGSQAAVRAALWAVDEVAGTDIPLRLLYIREMSPTASRSETRAAMVTAEEAVYEAYNAVNAVGEPVKVEMEIVEGRPVPALIHASESTPLLCVGDTLSGQPSPAGFGSTVTELLHSAHCSVAVVRGDHDEELAESRWVVVRVDGSPDDDNVLEFAFGEANRRNAPLVVMTAWRSGFDDLQNDRLIKDHERRMRAMLDRHVGLCTPHYPQVHVRTLAAYGTFLNYLTEHAKAIQLVVVGATHTSEVQEIVGPNADPALRHSDFALLVAR